MNYIVTQLMIHLAVNQATQVQALVEEAFPCTACRRPLRDHQLEYYTTDEGLNAAISLPGADHPCAERWIPLSIDSQEVT